MRAWAAWLAAGPEVLVDVEQMVTLGSTSQEEGQESDDKYRWWALVYWTRNMLSLV